MIQKIFRFFPYLPFRDYNALMKNILVYSFVSNPFNDQLKEKFKCFFVLNKLSEDLPRLKVEILARKPRYILGIANFRYKIPQFETLAINRFHKIRKVSKEGPPNYPIYVPNLLQSPFIRAIRPSDTFCNWTMYKVVEFIEQQELDIKLMFVHMREENVDGLVGIVERNYNTMLEPSRSKRLKRQKGVSI